MNKTGIPVNLRPLRAFPRAGESETRLPPLPQRMKGEALPKQRLRVLGVDLQGLVSISERVCVLSQLGLSSLRRQTSEIGNQVHIARKEGISRRGEQVKMPTD